MVNTTTDKKVDVLISGAGPVGLFFALRMASMNHTFKIIEKRQGATHETRAVGITARTLEVLHNRKLASCILKKAMTLQGAQMFSNGKKIAQLNMNADTIFPHISSLPQHDTEETFADLLGKDHISWNTKLIGYKQDSEGVEALVQNVLTGEEETIHARYIVGADGTHSAVRKLADDWSYEGYSVGTKFVVGDVILEGKDVGQLCKTRANGFFHPEGIFGIIPVDILEDGECYYRLFGNLGPYEVTDGKYSTHGISQHETITKDELQEVLKSRLAPLDINVKDARQLSIFRINERKANGFRRNRAFVVGDAAHCHSPFGGQGLNLGIQDADNLSWKLSMVLDGLSTDPEQLLDSYSAEREPIDAATMEATGYATRTLLGNSFLFSIFAKYALPVVLSMDRVMKPFMASMLQIAVELPKESPLLPQATPTTDLIAPGQYIRETVSLRKRLINNDDFERTTLHHLLQNTIPQYTILWVSSRSSCYSGNPLTRAFWSKFNDTYAIPAATIKPIIVESAHHSWKNKLPTYVTTKGYEEAFWLEEHWDAEHSLSNRIGLDKYLQENKLESPPAAILIFRPDRYVAYSGLVNSTSDINTAFNFLGNYLVTK